MEAARAPAKAAAGERIAGALAWTLAAVLAVGFTFAGAAKLLSNPAMVQEFARIGAGQWLRYVTGVLEMTGAIALLIPRLRFFGALQIAAVMAGATVVNAAILHVATWKLTAILLAAMLAWFRREEGIGRRR